MPKKYVIHGMSPEGCEHELGSCGWNPIGKGVLFTPVRAFNTERRINAEGEWIAWRVEQGYMAEDRRE